MFCENISSLIHLYKLFFEQDQILSHKIFLLLLTKQEMVL